MSSVSPNSSWSTTTPGHGPGVAGGTARWARSSGALAPPGTVVSGMRSGSHPESQDDAGDGPGHLRDIRDPHALVGRVGELEPRRAVHHARDAAVGEVAHVRP